MERIKKRKKKSCPKSNKFKTYMLETSVYMFVSMFSAFIYLSGIRKH